VAVSQSIRHFSPCPCRECKNRRQRDLRANLDSFYGNPADLVSNPPATWRELFRGLAFAVCFGFVLWSFACL
jgi:hypothetical protein